MAAASAVAIPKVEISLDVYPEEEHRTNFPGGYDLRRCRDRVAPLEAAILFLHLKKNPPREGVTRYRFLLAGFVREDTATAKTETDDGERFAVSVENGTVISLTHTVITPAHNAAPTWVQHFEKGVPTVGYYIDHVTGVFNQPWMFRNGMTCHNARFVKP